MADNHLINVRINPGPIHRSSTTAAPALSSPPPVMDVFSAVKRGWINVDLPKDSQSNIVGFAGHSNGGINLDYYYSGAYI